MHTNGKYVVAISALFALTLAACGGSSNSSSSKAAPINIGFIGALTGPDVDVVTALLNGAQLAGSLANSDGGVLGHQVVILAGDSHGDPADAIPVVRKMLALDNLHAMVGPTGLEFQGMLPILQASKMVTFSHVGDPSIDHLKDSYIYSTGPSDALLGTAMAMYAHQKGYKRIALAFDAEASGQTLVPGLLAAAAKLGLQVVANPSLPVGVVSYSAQVREIVAAHPDAILTQMQENSAGPFFSELAQSGGGSIPLIGSDLTAETAFAKTIGPSEAAHLVSVEGGTNVSGPGYATFLSNFKAKFGKLPLYTAVFYYDGLNVAMLAMIAAKSTDPTVYVNKIADVTTPGPGITDVYNFAEGAKLLKEGKRIKYVGVATPMIFNAYHRVVGPFEVVTTSSSGNLTVIANISADAVQVVVGG